MKQVVIALSAAFIAAGCSQIPRLQTGSLQAAPPVVQTAASPTRGRPVVAGRPARMYIFAGFKEKDCTPVEATLAVAQQPSKGTVEFKPGQSTTIMQSGSGKCIGAKMQGTGVYYTAAKGQSGPDRFVVSATTPNGQVSTKTFNLKIEN